jgi:hypothetical protein
MKRYIQSLVSRWIGKLIDFVRNDPRTSPATKLAILLLHQTWQAIARRGEPLPGKLGGGVRIFSQFEEDGILLYLDAVLELETKIFVDIGSSDGINSNCANLALNLGYTGLFIDSEAEAIERGRRFYGKHPDSVLWPPIFVEAVVTRENINNLITRAGFSGPIDVMSIDIDGNDYWVWEALEAVQPNVVVIETHIEFGMRDIVVPYDPEYVYPGRHPDYFSASPVAMVKLARRKGYRLVGANRYGFNLFFVKNGCTRRVYPRCRLRASCSIRAILPA